MTTPPPEPVVIVDVKDGINNESAGAAADTTVNTTTGHEATAALKEEDIGNIPFNERLKEVVWNYLPLSWITFGGPQAHIALLLELFVVRKKWLTEAMFTELFAISNAMPGPASTQLAFTVALIRGGVAPGIIAFFIWSLPGGIIMASLGLGVGKLGAAGIPNWILHVENGLAAVAVALVANAAYKLGCKILSDNVNRLLAVVAGGLVINFTSTPWLIPVLMVVGGVTTYLEHLWKVHQESKKTAAAIAAAESANAAAAASSNGTAVSNAVSQDGLRQRNGAAGAKTDSSTPGAQTPATTTPPTPAAPAPVPDMHVYFTYSVKAGAILIITSISLLIVAAILRALDINRPLSIFGTFYFVGHIIFGGGPVVVPLLYSYVVTNGWLTASEFLIGLAIINAMPGPNFNFAAYCGALALRDTVGTSYAGALLAWVGIFLPGLLLKAGILPIWKQYRGLPMVKVVFKGLNAVAVGLVFSATYLLWEKAVSIGPAGHSLGEYPFFVAVAALAYVFVEFIKVPAPWVVLAGGLVGLAEWGYVKD
ncbi:hypothetical protein HDU76_013058 [Blyttiomyces sp. JEL0837]|nr:hypothetical protein HDU76_013058 [Blyttiomyces sp. JEL0837]